MLKLLVFGLFGHHRMFQYKWARKLHKGKFYYMETGLSMFPFWDDVKFTNCQARCLKEEEWE